MDRFYTSDYRGKKSKIDLTKHEDQITGEGGSCFPAGTLVRTQHGYTPIENLNTGDVVLSYDRFGEVEFGLISAVHKHVGSDISDHLYIFNNGQLKCTGNHAIYDHTTNEHKEAKEFQIGENFTDMGGNLIEITSIDVQPVDTYGPDFTVYNFEIEPHHTYFVGTPDCWFKVHNGGGGKSSGSARAAQEAPNTLRSSAVVRVLEVLSEGEIVGVVGGAKGTYINGTVLQNADNTYNFNNVSFDQRYGLPSQTYIPGFSEIETEQLKNVVVTYASPVTQTITNSNVTAARITISFPDGLWKQNTSNGDLNGNSIQYSIETKLSSSSTWTTALTKTLKGKTTSAYEIAHRVQKPSGTGSWDVRVTRLQADDTSAASKTKFAFARWTEIQEVVLTYDNTAYVGLTVPAESVGNQIPTRGYMVQGVKVKIPSNYNPTTRVYTGTWDGTFTTAWTDNPAWCLYDIITNTRYGVSTYLNYYVNVDKWAFYNAAVYNDGLVPDGKGGQEARFIMNMVLQTQTDEWQLLHAMASNMRAMLAMAGNMITIVQDRPTTATKIITNANVIDGIFTYHGTDNVNRATAVNITFNDKNDFYLPRTISLENNNSGSSNSVNYQNGINKWGYTVHDYQAVGCVTESQALRMARWYLYSEAYQAEFCTFTLALNVADVSVGDVVKVMDEDFINNTGVYLTGRVVSSSGTSIVLSNPVTLVAGKTYTIGVTNLANDNIEERTITTTAGTYSTLSINSALPAGDYVNKEFFCYSPGYVEPRQFKIVSIRQAEHGKWTVVGQFYDPNKWSIVEQGITVATQTYSTLSTTVVPQVSNITFSEVFKNDGINQVNYISVKWDFDPNRTIQTAVTFFGKWRRDNNAYTDFQPTSLREFTIPDTAPGVYEVIIYAQDSLGRTGLDATNSYNYHIEAGTSTLEPPTNFYVTGTTGTTFTTTNCALSWTFPTSNSTKSRVLLDYIVEIWSSDGLTLKNTYTVQPDSAKGGQFNYVFQYNLTDFVTPQRTFIVKVYSRDTIGDKSSAVVKTFTNPAPAVVSFNVISGIKQTFIDITAPADTDIAGYQVFRGTTAGFTKDSASLIYDGIDNHPVLNTPTVQQYYYAAAAYDTFGKNGLNVSGEQSSTPLSLDAVTWSKSGVNFTVNSSSNVASWTAGTITKSGTTNYSITAGSFTWSSGINYIYFNPLTSATTLQVTTTLGIATAGWIIATYAGGTDLKGGDGSAFFSGSQVLAGTIGANQLITNTAVITGAAQIQDGIIINAKIQDAAITAAKIADANITAAKIADANITTAKIADAAITAAKIVDASVSTLKIEGRAVTVPIIATTAASVGLSTSAAEVQSLVVPVMSTTETITLIVTCGFSGSCSATDTSHNSMNIYGSLSSSLGTHVANTMFSGGTKITNSSAAVAAAASVTCQINLPANTSITLSLKAYHNGNSASVSNRFISVIGARR